MTPEVKAHCLSMAEAIAAAPEAYDQKAFLFNCGTTACLAGWSLAVKEHDGEIPDFQIGSVNDQGVADLFDRAAEYMGLDDTQAGEAFDSDPWWTRYGRTPSAKDVVHSLKKYVESGEWRWRRALEEGPLVLSREGRE